LRILNRVDYCLKDVKNNFSYRKKITELEDDDENFVENIELFSV